MNKMTLIVAKFDADLINIFEITSRKTKWPRFLAKSNIGKKRRVLKTKLLLRKRKST